MSTPKPLLSICVPSHKKAAWLEASLRITLEQVKALGPLVEVVVSDDASPDNSLEVLARLKAEYPDYIRYYPQEKNLKNNKNYLFTLDQSHGDFVWLLGNDDFLRPGAVQKVVETLQANPEIDFVYMSYSFFRPPATPAEMPKIEDLPIDDETMAPCFYGKHNFTEKPLKWLGEIPAYDALCFTPMYAGIVRHKLWRDAFAFNAASGFFHKLDSSFGYAAYLAKNALHKPGYYIGYPYVAASRDITWGAFAASACLRNMPVMYDILETEGVQKNVLRFIRDDYLKLIRTSIPYVLQYRSLYYHDEFSFWEHTRRFWSYPQYWKNLKYIIPRMTAYWMSPNYLGPLLKRTLPAPLYNALKGLKKKPACHENNC